MHFSHFFPNIHLPCDKSNPLTSLKSDGTSMKATIAVYTIQETQTVLTGNTSSDTKSHNHADHQRFPKVVSGSEYVLHFRKIQSKKSSTTLYRRCVLAGNQKLGSHTSLADRHGDAHQSNRHGPRTIIPVTRRKITHIVFKPCRCAGITGP